MDSLNARKKISLPKAKFHAAENDPSEKRKMIDDWFKKDDGRYYEDVEIPVQKMDGQEDGKRSGSWFNKLFFSGIDLKEEDSEKYARNGKEEITFFDISSAEDEPTEDIRVRQETNIIVETEEAGQSDIPETGDEQRIIKVRNETEVSDIEIVIKDDEEVIEETAEMFSGSEEIDKEYEEEKKAKIFTLEEEAELVFLIREAQNFWREINGFDWEKSGYLEEGKEEAIRLAVEAHTRKLINVHSIELKNMEEEIKEDIIEDIYNIIKKDNA